MRRFLLGALLALLLVPASIALASGHGKAPAPSFPLQSTRVVDLPFSTTFPLFEEDAGTVAHVYWNGTALVDTKGNVWTMNGTVPQVAAGAPLYPQGFSASGRAGAGPFSDLNYYSLPGSPPGNDVLDFAGDFSACIVYAANAIVADQALISDGSALSAGLAGYAVEGGRTAGPTVVFETGGADRAVTDSGGAESVGTLNVLCVGRAGTTGYLKVNLRALVTGLAGSVTPGTSYTAKLGRGEALGYAFNGQIYEFWASTTTPSDLLFTRIQRRIFQQLGALQETLTVSRAGAQSYEFNSGGAPPTLFYVPPNIGVVNAAGLQVEPAATNLLLQSEALDTIANWTATNVTVAANAGKFADGNTSMETLTSTVNTGTVAQAVTVTSSTGPFTVAGWIASPSGSAVVGTIGMTFGAGNATGCSCVRNDGGACVVGTSTATGYAYMLTPTNTNPVRLGITCSTTLATTTVTPFATGGQYLSATGAVYAGGMQMTLGKDVRPYIPTTTATVAAPADVPTVANPLANLSGVPPFCVDGTFTPYNGRPWGNRDTHLATVDAVAAANTWQIHELPGTGIQFLVYDAAASPKTWTTAFPSAGAHRITTCYPAGTIWYDGVSQSVVASGPGTGILATHKTPVYLGTDATGGSEFLGGIQNFKVCSPATSLADCTKQGGSSESFYPRY